MWHLNAERVCQGRGRPQGGQRESFRGQGGQAARAQPDSGQRRERIKKPAKRPRRLFSRSEKADQETGLSSFTGSASTFSTFVAATVPIFT